MIKEATPSQPNVCHARPGTPSQPNVCHARPVRAHQRAVTSTLWLRLCRQDSAIAFTDMLTASTDLIGLCQEVVALGGEAELSRALKLFELGVRAGTPRLQRLGFGVPGAAAVRCLRYSPMKSSALTSLSSPGSGHAPRCGGAQ